MLGRAWQEGARLASTSEYTTLTPCSGSRGEGSLGCSQGRLEPLFRTAPDHRLTTRYSQRASWKAEWLETCNLGGRCRTTFPPESMHVSKSSEHWECGLRPQPTPPSG